MAENQIKNYAEYVYLHQRLEVVAKRVFPESAVALENYLTGVRVDLRVRRHHDRRTYAAYYFLNPFEFSNDALETRLVRCTKKMLIEMAAMLADLAPGVDA